MIHRERKLETSLYDILHTYHDFLYKAHVLFNIVLFPNKTNILMIQTY